MDVTAASTPTDTVNVTATKPAKAAHLWHGKSFGFSDILDMLNPLQHLPVIGAIYRAVTGDTIGDAAKITGDAVYGGVIGAISGMIDVAVKDATGEDIGTHILATLGLISPPKPDETAVASAAKSPASASAVTPPLRATAGAASSSPPVATPSDSPQALPKFGSETTSSMLAAATSVTPLDVMKAMPAQAKPTAAAAPPTQISSATGARFMPIDTSDKGIMTLKAGALRSGTRPVPLNLPPGALPATGSSATPVDFVSKMREGLDKYQAMMAERSRSNQGSAVNQLQ